MLILLLLANMIKRTSFTMRWREIIGRFKLQAHIFLWGVGREMDVRWMESLSSGGDELGKTWVQYNAKYVKSFLNAGYDTPWKMNMEPTNHLIEKEIHLPNYDFQVAC